MKMTQGAIGNLCNRYRAVLKKCRLLNTFGSLAVAAMLVMGGTGVAGAADTVSPNALLSFTGSEFLANSNRINEETGTFSYTTDGDKLSITAENQIHRRGVVTNLHTINNTSTEAVSDTGLTIEGSIFTDNATEGNSTGYGGGAVTLWGTQTALTHTISNSSFTNNKASAGAGGAVAIYEWGTDDVASNTTITDTTFTSNNAAIDGGAIYAELESIALEGKTTFTGNSAVGNGGAIAFNSNPSTLTDTGGATFTKNTAGNVGGAIYNTAGSTVTLTGSTFSDNTAGTAGGAIYNAGTLDLDTVTFDGNGPATSGTGINGGAIRNTSNATISSITNSKFTNNNAGTSMGGAISNQGSIESIQHTNFTGNKGNGGAINNNTNGVINEIANSTFDGNSAVDSQNGQGGAITNAGSIVTVKNSTFTGNSARTLGGAIANVKPQSSDTARSIKFENVTFTGNSVTDADGGGAIYNSETFAITLTGTNTFSGNTAAGEANDIYNEGDITVTSGTTTLDGGLVLADGTVTVKDNGNLNGVVTWKNGSAATTGNALISVDGNGATLSGNINTGADSSASVASVNTDASGNTSISGADFNGNTLAAGSNYPLVGTVVADLSAGQSLTVTDSAFTGNTVELTANGSSGMSGGAAISARGQGEGARLTISDSSFSGNTYKDTPDAKNGAYGGAVGVQNMDVTLNNVSMKGNAGDSGNQVQGGAYYQSVGSLNATGITVTDNAFKASSNVMGAGMVLWGTEGSIDGNSLFSGNKATTEDSAHGGGLYLRGSRWGGESDLAFTISNTTFSGNSLISTTDGAYGGGLYVKGDAANSSSTDKNGHVALNIANVTFTGNTVSGATASQGGALHIDTDASDSSVAAVTITGSTFTDNKAEGTNGWGGAIYNAGDLNIDNTTFENNIADAQGGAIFVHPEGILNTANSSFTGNQGTAGGAIAVFGDNGATPEHTITNTTFEGNKAFREGDKPGKGGAIAVLKMDSPSGEGYTTKLNLTDVTFTGNASNGSGGAIHNESGTLALSGTSFTDNTAGTLGGAIYNDADSSITFTGTNTLSGNTAAGEANDIYNEGGITVDGGATTMDAMVQAAGALQATNSAQLNIGTLDARGGNVFAENASLNISNVADNAMGSNLFVGTGAVANIGGVTNADLLQGINDAGVDASRAAVLAVASPIALTDDAQVVVADGVNASGQIGGTPVAAGAYFGDGSLFIVDAGKLAGNAAITAGNKKDAVFTDGSTLQIINATRENITVLDGFSVTDGAGQPVDFSGVSVDNPDRMLTSSVSSDAAGNIIVSSAVNTASDVLPGLSHELNAPMAYVWDNAINSVDAAEAGVRFLSRAARTDYIADAGKAARTIESASRMAFAGAVPQMTKLASDATTSVIINRLSLTNPIDGTRAVDASGQLVDRNNVGFALWFAPLWQYQRGWNMDAGSLNYGYEGNIGGAALGADYTFDNAIRAGVTLSVGGGHAESDGGDLAWTENDMDFWSVGAYAGWTRNNFAVMGDLSYTQSTSDLNQNLDAGMGMGNLSADVDGRALSMGVRAEYKLATSLVDVTPHLGVRYMWLDTRGYDVKAGNSSVLESDGFSQNIWTFPVGVTFSRDFVMENGWYIKPNLDVSVIPAAGDVDGEDRFRFTGVPVTTSMETQIMDHLTWQGGVGLELGNSENMNLGVNYILQAGEDVVGHGVFGTFSYKF